MYQPIDELVVVVAIEDDGAFIREVFKVDNLDFSEEEGGGIDTV